MPAKNDDLHGNVPDNSTVALLIIDVINDLEFEGGAELLQQAVPVAKRIAELKKQASQIGIPAIYINDNFGRWQSDFKMLVQHCLEDDVRGKAITELLKPADNDYFVLKPKHSGFFATALDTLLSYLQVETLILTGLTGDVCVLFTANDAYLRDVNIFVPSDCVASIDPAENQHALKYMARVLKADIRPSSELDLAELQRKVSQAGKRQAAAA